jgi:hypothetical protein
VKFNRTMLGVVGLGLLALAAGQGNPEPQQAPGPEPEPYNPKYDPKKPPGYVPRPAGWVSYKGTVSQEMSQAASQAVNDKTTTFGTFIPRGTIAETGKQWAVFIEWHFHPKGQGYAAEGWHKGATILTQA